MNMNMRKFTRLIPTLTVVMLAGHRGRRLHRQVEGVLPFAAGEQLF